MSFIIFKTTLTLVHNLRKIDEDTRDHFWLLMLLPGLFSSIPDTRVAGILLQDQLKGKTQKTTASAEIFLKDPSFLFFYTSNEPPSSVVASVCARFMYALLSGSVI